MKIGIPKQRVIPGLGEAVDATYTTMPLFSIINFVSILIVLYASSRPWIQEYLPWLGLGSFAAMLVGVILLGLVLVYLYVLPSLWAFRKRQMEKDTTANTVEMEFRKEVIERLERLERKNDTT